jgi:prepilin-type processing-associated H-X9-DG protein
MAHFWLMDTGTSEGMGTTLEIDEKRHASGMSNYIYIDGHVETQPFNKTFDIKNKIDIESVKRIKLENPKKA